MLVAIFSTTDVGYVVLPLLDGDYLKARSSLGPTASSSCAHQGLRSWLWKSAVLATLAIFTDGIELWWLSLSSQECVSPRSAT